MSEPTFDEVPELPAANPPLQMARAYYENARRIGEPGSPTMIEAAALMAQHADMARTAALVSIAGSLDSMVRDQANMHRRSGKAIASLDAMAKELYKLRNLARGRRL